MMHYLSEIIKERKIEKYYIAIVFWKVKNRKFKIESYIWRDPNDRQKMTALNPVNPKIAITYWEVLDYIDNKYSLLKIKIETWRTHQIRVHLSSIWYPIVWDKVYGNSKINKHFSTLYQLKRQALHAYSLELELYWNKKKFIAHLKKDMLRIIWMNEEKN
jgi:23S rRNA pseudouridine1911/1915/1917 synthase